MQERSFPGGAGPGLAPRRQPNWSDRLPLAGVIGVAPAGVDAVWWAGSAARVAHDAGGGTDGHRRQDLCPGPDLALLRQVSFFRPLPFAIVEHLASELQPATYEPGDVIIREGEPGDRFYIIAAGRARAAKDGKQLREMGTGDSFGEIALLRRIPRTATVTATSRLEARTLAREDFLAAVTGNPESVQSAEEVVSTRLQAG